MSEAIQTKHCTKCKKIKSLSEFHKNKRMPDGHHGWCKMCRNKAEKERRQRPEIKAVNRARQQTTKYKRYARKYAREYRRKNKTSQKDYQRFYRQTERGKASIRASRHEYDKSEKGKQNQKRRRQKDTDKCKARIVIGNAVKSGNILAAKYLLCSHCPKQAQEYHHHLGYAPEHWLDVIPLCRKCHKS